MILKYSLVSHTVASFPSSFTIPFKQHKSWLEITVFSVLLCSFTSAAGVTYITAAIQNAEFFQTGMLWFYLHTFLRVLCFI
jgi:hypothetical protein